MGALAAVSLAANVFDFVNFGDELLSKTFELHRSATGSLQEDDTMRTVCDSLKTQAQQCDNQPTPPMST